MKTMKQWKLIKMFRLNSHWSDNDESYEKNSLNNKFPFKFIKIVVLFRKKRQILVKKKRNGIYISSIN